MLKPNVEELEIIEIKCDKPGDRGAIEEIAGGDQRAVNQQCVLAGHVQVVVRNVGAER
jgi:hypothetical protein